MGIIISKTASSSWARSHHILVARHEFQCQLPMSELSAAHQHVKTSGVLPLGPWDPLLVATTKRKCSENLHSVLFLDDFPTYFPRKKWGFPATSSIPAPEVSAKTRSAAWRAATGCCVRRRSGLHWDLGDRPAGLLQKLWRVYHPHSSTKSFPFGLCRCCTKTLRYDLPMCVL